jgi:Flp pilus assembly pilin Flp
MSVPGNPVNSASRRVRDLALALIRDDRAQTTIEYALLTGIIAVAAISALERIRVQILDIFFIVNGALSNAPTGDAG